MNMIHQEAAHSELHLNEQLTPMDWCENLLDDLNPKPADPPTLSQDQWKEKETSSYGKSSCVLPITFFDIQSNIQYLNQCNPLSIQVVDCDKHPWYYKKYTRSYRPGKSVDKMDNTSKPHVKFASMDVDVYIDLTENACNSLTDSSSNSLNNIANLNKVVANEAKLPSVTKTRKTKSHKVSKSVLRDDFEKLKARGQINLSKIDLKHNTGLVGLRITPAIESNSITLGTKPKKSKPLPSIIKNNELDESFNAASKTLGLLGTIILPVANENKSDKEVLSNKTYDRKISSQAVVSNINQSVVAKPGPKRSKTLQSKDTPFSELKIADVIEDVKNTPEQRLSSNSEALLKKTSKHPKVKKIKETKRIGEDIFKRADVPSTYVNKNEPSCQKEIQNKPKTNERTIEEVSRSKSPVFPCKTNKQKPQSELLKHLAQNVTPHIEKSSTTPKGNIIGQEIKIFIKDWPKSAYELIQTPPNATKTLHVNKIISTTNKSEFDKAQSQNSGSIEGNYKNSNVNPPGSNYTVDPYPTPIETDKRATVIKAATTTVKIPVQKVPKSDEPKESSKPSDFNQYTRSVDTAYSIANKVQCLKNCLPNSIPANANTNVNLRNKSLAALYLHHYGLKKSKLTPRVFDKTKKINKIPLQKPELPVAPAPPNINVPVQTPVANRPESNPECSGKIRTNVLSQNNVANFPTQPMPGTLPSYCKVNGVPNNFVHRPNCHAPNTNRFPINIGNSNIGWDPRLHFPVPPFMHPPPLFLPPPPPPPPSVLEQFRRIITTLQNQNRINKQNASNENNENNNNDVNAIPNPKSSEPSDKKIPVTNHVKNSVQTPDLQFIGQERCPATETKMAKTSDNDTSIANTQPFNQQVRHNVEENKRNENIIRTPSNKLRIPHAEENKRPEEIIRTLSNKPKLSQYTYNNVDILSVQKKKATNVCNTPQKDTLPVKDNTNNNPNKIAGLHDITITPVAKEVTSTPHNNNKVPQNNIHQNRKRIDKICDNVNNDRSLSHAGNNKMPKNNKNDLKRKPGPLCMKNRTGPFAVKNASSPARIMLPAQSSDSQPNKGYSPPILPIPTFQTILAQTHDLQLQIQSMINTPKHLNTLPMQQLCSPAQIKKPHGNYSDKSSRKRIHFEDKGNNEVKKLKKISLEDYKNRPSDIANDPVRMPADRKCARKSEHSCKSAKSLADVVNQSLMYEL